MSLLGVFYKQPIEVEYYSIQYSKDLTATDELTSAWQIIASDSADAWDRVVRTAPYTVLVTDMEKILVTTASITTPIGAPEGFRFYVSNQSQSAAVTVDAISIPARGASIFTLQSGVWVQEAKSEGILVDVVGDQRVRNRVFGGLVDETYKIQVTVTTAEGRTLQDEFTVTIEET